MSRTYGHPSYSSAANLLFFLPSFLLRIHVYCINVSDSMQTFWHTCLPIFEERSCLFTFKRLRLVWHQRKKEFMMPLIWIELRYLDVL